MTRTDWVLGVVAVGGVVVGPLAALWAFLESPCGPDSTTDVCVLAAPHVTAVLLPLVAGPVAAVLAVVLAVALRRRPRARRRSLLAAALTVVLAAAVAPAAILAAAPTSYPNAYVPR